MPSGGRQPPHLAFCDIDDFKRINDSHGHEAGDRVIQAIAQILQRMSGEKCHVARHGGEEFVLIFRDKTPVQVHDLLDEARERLARRNFINRQSEREIGALPFRAVWPMSLPIPTRDARWRPPMRRFIAPNELVATRSAWPDNLLQYRPFAMAIESNCGGVDVPNYQIRLFICSK
jgi:hypothetical protein